MIEIVIEEEMGMIHAEGHAGYAEHGKDIVCAAVSAVMDLAARVALQKNGGHADEDEDGGLTVWGYGFAFNCVLKAVKAELEAIEEKYPAYVKVRETSGGDEAWPI